MCTVPVWSWAAMTLAPLMEQAGGGAADVAEALHHHARAATLMFRSRAASQPTTNTPRPVASTRPRLPPSAIGLPVTTPVAVEPSFMEYVSIIQAMVWALVFTSGAGCPWTVR